MPGVPEWVRRICHEWSTDRFSPQHGGYKYNHLYQGVVALWLLGSTEDQCNRYIERAITYLEPAEVGKEYVHTGHKLMSEERLKELLGKRESYNDLVAHYRQRLADLDNDRDLYITTELPGLAAGLSSGLFHGLIQLGYGFVSSDERLLAEGFAYMHYRYMPYHVTNTELFDNLGAGDTDILDVLKEVKEQDLTEFADKEKLLPNDARHRTKIQTRMLTLLTLRGDYILSMVNRIRFPNWFDKDDLSSQQLQRIGNWILDCTILVYGMAELKNNFGLLHGVTSAWALAKILPSITNKTEALKTIAYYLSCLVAIYVTLGCPALDMEHLESLEQGDWEDILKKTLEIDSEVHVYKLVQVCYGRSKENDDPKMAEVYKKAAYTVTHSPYTFMPTDQI